MDLATAFNNVARAAAAAPLDLASHNAVQESLKLIKEELDKVLAQKAAKTPDAILPAQ